MLALVLLAVAPAVQQRTLPNGLDVIVVENHALPLTTVEIAAKNGSMAEAPEYNGLSHLYEHMFFKSNKVIPSQEAYLARLRELGMSFNGTTNTERVNYFFTTTSDHFAESLSFLRDAITSPLFEGKELEKERRVVVGEIDRNESQPQYYLFHTVTQHTFWKYPSRKDPLGNRETVLGLPKNLVNTPDDKLPPGVLEKAVKTVHDKMVTIQNRYYVPNNSALVVTGDVKADDVFTLAASVFAEWKRSDDPFKKFPLVQHPPLKRSEVVLVEQPVGTVSGILQWHGPSTVGKDVDLTYAADLLSYVTDQPPSKFQKDLIDSGACINAGIGWYTQKNVGPISVNFEATPEKADACVSAILAELPKMKSPEYATDVEMKNAAYRAEVDQARERETPSGLAHTLSFWWASAGTDYYLGYVEHMRQVKREDIARYLDSYVLGKPFVFGVMVSPEMKKDKGLDQAHFEKLAGLKAGAPAGVGGASR